MRTWLLILCLLSGCAQLPLPTPDAPALQFRSFSPWPDAMVHVARIDLRQPGLRVILTPPAERGRAVDAMRGTAQAMAVMNASFFDKQFAPRGQTRSQGVDWPDAKEVDAFPVFACDATAHCEVLLKPDARPWQTVAAGVPALLKDGVDVSGAGCAARAKFCDDQHPRSAVGLADGGRVLLLVVAEGRRPPVMGMRIPELVKLMRELGATDALNLDGGGSSTLTVQGEQRMGRPFNEPALRKIANALMVVD